MMADKCFDPEDPMEFIGVGMLSNEQGFADMVEAIVEEYMMLGWPDRVILGMFRNPFYQLPHAVYRLKGEPYVQGVIRRVREMWSAAGGKGEPKADD